MGEGKGNDRSKRRRPVDAARVRQALARIKATLRDHPEIAQRTADYFAGRLEGEAMSKPKKGKATGTEAMEAVVPIRIPGELLERADVLGRSILADPEMSFLLGRAGGKVSRTAVLRLALLEGIKVLESRYRT